MSVSCPRLTDNNPANETTGAFGKVHASQDVSTVHVEDVGCVLRPFSWYQR